jgi:hypothetical protein
MHFASFSFEAKMKKEQKRDSQLLLYEKKSATLKFKGIE